MLAELHFLFSMSQLQSGRLSLLSRYAIILSHNFSFGVTFDLTNIDGSIAASHTVSGNVMTRFTQKE